MMLDWTAIEDALREYAFTATGLGPQALIFEGQNGSVPDPTSPFMTIALGDLVKKGRDSVSTRFDAGEVGEEIRIQTFGLRKLTVTFQAFGPKTTTPDNSEPTARTLASKLEAYIELPSVRGRLNAAGLGVLEVGPVRWLPKLVNTKFEGRALLEVKFAVGQGAEDALGYFDKVSGTATVDADGVEHDVPFSAELE